MPPHTITILGGGAAGFFAAVIAKQTHPAARVTILEKTAQLLGKVRISGGGRCNVTHACFDPKELVKNYPRGHKELLGPFHRFQPRDTMEWFESRGVRLKAEEDGRVFPRSDSSETIIQCLMQEAASLGVVIRTQTDIQSIAREEEGFVLTGKTDRIVTDRLILATGNSRIGHQWAQGLGHTIQPAVPSLFTFNCPPFGLTDLAGIAVPHAVVSLQGRRLKQSGPLLITHWGFSGPAALKLSAWEARYLAEQNYKVGLTVCWVGDRSKEDVLQWLQENKHYYPSQSLYNHPYFDIPKNLWNRLLERSRVPDGPLAMLRNEELGRFAETLTQDLYQVDGKTTHKAEFVTCGGVTLSEVHFQTMESRLCPGLFFVGEILDIDGVTGGFNFQNAWTTGFLAGTASGK